VTPQCKSRTARRWPCRRTTLDTRSSLPAVPARTASPLARSLVSGRRIRRLQRPSSTGTRCRRSTSDAG
jgi:hypothetical protein